MAKNFNTKLNTGLVTIRFTDEDGDVISYFKMNPADVHLAKRAEEISEYFATRSSEMHGETVVDDLIALDAEICAKIDYLLGYEASKTAFMPPMSATTILPDGTLFAEMVIDRIVSAVAPEVKKRSDKMKERVSSHTAAYIEDPAAGLAPGQQA